MTEAEQLKQLLLWALSYADDGIQMEFDMERHGVVPHDKLLEHAANCNNEADIFNVAAGMVGYKSKYHPRMKDTQ